jgi:DNA-binding Lrp family transcriptional regulator
MQTDNAPGFTDTQLLQEIQAHEIGQRTGPTLGELGTALGFSRQAVHKRIVALEREGIVERLHTGYGLTKTGKRLVR